MIFFNLKLKERDNQFIANLRRIFINFMFFCKSFVGMEVHLFDELENSMLNIGVKTTYLVANTG